MSPVLLRLPSGYGSNLARTKGSSQLLRCVHRSRWVGMHSWPLKMYVLQHSKKMSFISTSVGIANSRENATDISTSCTWCFSLMLWVFRLLGHPVSIFMKFLFDGTTSSGRISRNMGKSCWSTKLTQAFSYIILFLFFNFILYSLFFLELLVCRSDVKPF